jgi:hypothetical protein
VWEPKILLILLIRWEPCILSLILLCDHRPSQKFPRGRGGGANRRFAYKLKFKPFKTIIFIACPTVSSIQEYIFQILLIFGIVTCRSDYRRGMDSWLDLLATYALTSRDYTLQITVTHRLVPSVYYSLHSLTELHTPDITHKVFSSQPDFQLRTLATITDSFLQTSVQNWLGCPNLDYNISARSSRKYSSPILVQTCLPHRCLATLVSRTTESTSLLFLRSCMLWALRRNGGRLHSHRLATGLYAKSLIFGIFPPFFFFRFYCFSPEPRWTDACLPLPFTVGICVSVRW